MNHDGDWDGFPGTAEATDGYWVPVDPMDLFETCEGCQ